MTIILRLMFKSKRNTPAPTPCSAKVQLKLTANNAHVLANNMALQYNHMSGSKTEFPAKAW